MQSRYAADTSVNTYLTADEQKWVSTHSTLTIGYLNNYLPYCATEADGSPTGLMIDVIPSILDKMPGDWAPELEYRSFDDQADLVAALKNGEVDLAFPVGGETWYAEEMGYLRSSSIASPVMDLVVPESYNPDTMASCIAVNRNNLMQRSYVETNFPDARILECNSIEDCFAAVKSGKATSTVVNGLRATALLNSEAKLMAIQLPETDDRCFGVAAGNGPLLQLVNRGIDIIGSDYSTNASYAYTKSLFKYTWVDFIRDNLVSLVLVALAVVALAVFLAVSRFRKLKSVAQHESQMNRQLEEALKDAEAANHTKDMLLRNLSHDIRTPLNGILGAMDLNANAPDNASAKSSLVKARGASRQLVSLVDDLLEINTLRTGKVQMVEDEFFPAALLSEVVAESADFAKDTEVELSLCAFPSELAGLKVRGCPECVHKVLINVVDNAIRYNKAHGTVQVSASSRPLANEKVQFICTVKDTGIGMSEEDVARMCEPFYQADEGARSIYPGSGLGMPIVSDLLKLMGGTLDVSSAPGSGTTVTVGVPFAVVERFAEPSTDKPSASSAEGMRVLLAEDNELNREVTQFMLQRMGVEVDMACDGKEALEVFSASEEGTYDMVLMDVMMPVMDGIASAKAIRQLDRADADVPIIAVTAKVTEEDRRAVLAAGMNAHLAKPLEPEQLKAMLVAHRAN